MEMTREEKEARLKELEQLAEMKLWDIEDAEGDGDQELRDELLEELGELTEEEQELREELFPRDPKEIEKDNIRTDLQDAVAKAIAQRARELLSTGEDKELVKEVVRGMTPKGTFMAFLMKVYRKSKRSEDPILDIINTYGNE